MFLSGEMFNFHLFDSYYLCFGKKLSFKLNFEKIGCILQGVPTFCAHFQCVISVVNFPQFLNSIGLGQGCKKLIVSDIRYSFFFVIEFTIIVTFLFIYRLCCFFLNFFACFEILYLIVFKPDLTVECTDSAYSQIIINTNH